jgi:hypothetical protein
MPLSGSAQHYATLTPTEVMALPAASLAATSATFGYGRRSRCWRRGVKGSR